MDKRRNIVSLMVLTMSCVLVFSVVPARGVGIDTIDTPTPAPSASQTPTVIPTVVFANQYPNWQSTGVWLTRGDRFEISASGSCCYNSTLCYGPDGKGYSSLEGHLVDYVSEFSLVAKIAPNDLCNGTGFFAGESWSGTAARNGYLFLGFNDVCAYPGDNWGQYDVEIRIYPTGSPAPTFTPSPTPTATPTSFYNGSLELASSERVIVPSSPSLSALGAEATLECHLLIETSGAQMVISKGGGATDAFEYRVEIDPGHRLRFSIQGASGNDTVIGSTPLTTGIWYHLACVADPAALKIYLDGRLDGQKQTGVRLDAATTYPLTIGKPAGSNSGFSGRIDRIRISRAVRYPADFEPGCDLLPDTQTSGLWQCDEMSGNTLHDSSVNGNDGNVSGGVFQQESIQCESGRSVLSFPDLSSGYVEIPDRDSLSFVGESFTLEFWLYPRVLKDIILLSKWGTGGAEDDEYLVGISHFGKLTFSLGNSSWRHSMSVLRPYRWQHVACVYDRDLEEARVYIDGVLDQRFQALPLTINTQEPLFLGGQRLSLDYFQGSIDDIRVSRTARYTYNFEPACHLANDSWTEGLWHCDEGSGTVLHDSSGNDNSGTLHDVSFSSGESYCSQMISLDQNSDYLVVPDSGSLHLSGNAATIELYAFSDRQEPGWIIWKGDPADPSGEAFEWGLELTDNGLFRWILRVSGGLVSLNSDVASAANEWHHLALVFDRGAVRFFLDGRLTAQDVAPTHDMNADSSYPIAVYGGVFRGDIDSVRLSSSARYSGHFTPACDWKSDDQTLGLWTFDHRPGATAYDSSGHGNNGVGQGLDYTRRMAPCHRIQSQPFKPTSSSRDSIPDDRSGVLILGIPVWDVYCSTLVVQFDTLTDCHSYVEYALESDPSNVHQVWDPSDAVDHVIVVPGLPPDEMIHVKVCAQDGVTTDCYPPSGTIPFYTLSFCDDSTPPAIMNLPRQVGSSSDRIWFEWDTDELSSGLAYIRSQDEDAYRRTEISRLSRRHLESMRVDPGGMYDFALTSFDSLPMQHVNGSDFHENTGFPSYCLSDPDDEPPRVLFTPVCLFENDRIIIRIDASEASVCTYWFGSEMTGEIGPLQTQYPAGTHWLTQTFSADVLNPYFRFYLTDLSGNSSSTYGDIEITEASMFAINDSREPLLTSGPRVVAVSSDSVALEFETDRVSQGFVQYRAESVPDGITQLTDTYPGRHHVLILRNLLPQTTYQYRLGADGTLFADLHTFTTAMHPDTTPPVILSPARAQASTDTAIIFWETDEFSDAEVIYGRDIESYRAETVRATGARHTVVLGDLQPDQTYRFKTISRDAFGNTIESAPDEFTTTPDTARPTLTALPTMTINTQGFPQAHFETSEPAWVFMTSSLDGRPISREYSLSPETRFELTLSSGMPVAPIDVELRMVDSAANEGVYTFRYSPPSQTCDTWSVDLWMPDHLFHPSDTCCCWLEVCNPTATIRNDIPVFVVIELYGEYVFAPGFSSFDFYAQPLMPGTQSIQVIPAFDWPEGIAADTTSGMTFYAAVTDPGIQTLQSNLDQWRIFWTE